MDQSTSFKVKSLSGYLEVFLFILSKEPELVLLSGGLGAGKTSFVGEFLKYKHSLKDLSVNGFMSPTFSIINQYEVDEALYSHVDLYRLSEGEIGELGLEEVLQESDMTFIEWYEKSEELTRSLSLNKISIEIKKTSENEREVLIRL